MGSSGSATFSLRNSAEVTTGPSLVMTLAGNMVPAHTRATDTGGDDDFVRLNDE